MKQILQATQNIFYQIKFEVRQFILQGQAIHFTSSGNSFYKFLFFAEWDVRVVFQVSLLPSRAGII
jgi:hypothetical protein